MNMIEFIILGTVSICCLHILGTAIWHGIGPMPSSPIARATIRTMIPTEVRCICVLGSGWGSLAIDASKKCPKAQVIGIEVSFFPWLFSRIWSWLSRRKNVRLIWGNFHKQSLCEYDLILCYIHRAGMDALKEKLDTELQSGTYLLSNTFAVYGWKPIQVEKLNDLWKTRVILYQINPNTLRS